MSSLNERLGFATDDRVLIISCDDLGLSHSSNLGVMSALRNGVATCASIMVPAPWARHAAQQIDPGDDIGVHLTLNAEHDCYRFGPVTHAPSLLSGDGGFPAAIDDLWEHADPAEVRRELRTQVTRAQAWGIDVTHLAPHLSAITLRPEFFDAYLDVAVEFQLPIRLPSTVSAAEAGFPFRSLAADEGVFFPDFFNHDWRAGSRQRVLDAIEELPAGVTELHLQPAVDTPEIRALSSDAAGWIDDHAFLLEPEVRSALTASGIHLIGYRELREAMRSQLSSATS
ncbi:MAG: carbohydrate deacetylase [Ilumatobacteraceae bacterium]